MWCWGRRKKISWIDCVKNEEDLLRDKEEREYPHTVKQRKANLIGHILLGNCVLKCVIEGKIERRVEVTGR